MVETVRLNGGERNLAEFLRERARAASESRLALDVGVGAVAAIVAAALKPDWWLPLLVAGVCFAAFGIWAALYRLSLAREHPTRLDSVINVARGACAVVGILSALALIYVLWTLAIGTWIS